MRGTGPAVAVFAGGATAPRCAAAKFAADGANHTNASATAAKPVDLIQVRLIFATLPLPGSGLRPEETIHLSVRRGEFSQHPHILGSIPGADTLDGDLRSGFHKT